MPRTRGSLEARNKTVVSPPSLEPTVGSVHMVKRMATGLSLRAQVLEVERKECVRCYVHYESLDRRMDEWVGLEQFCRKESVATRSSSAQGCVKSRHDGRKRHNASHPASHRGNDQDPSLAERFEAAREAMTRVKNVPVIVFSNWEIETWYWSPFPDEYHGSKLYICDYTLRYTTSKACMKRHAADYEKSGKPMSPPGKRVYAGSDGISLWEVRGNQEHLYCQNLCLIAKLFLDHKTLYYDVEPFLFYVLTKRVDEKKDNGEKKTEQQREKHHVLGYFSKEPNSPDAYNLSCILTFPQYQRNGYGTLLISLSYELSKRERKRGSPEKPLSDLGKLSYRSFWTWTVLTALKTACRLQEERDSSSKDDDDDDKRQEQAPPTNKGTATKTAKTTNKKRKTTSSSSQEMKEETSRLPVAAIPPISRLSLDALGMALGMKNDDICSTLHQLNMLRQWKGQAFICARKDDIDSHLRAVKRPPRLCEAENVLL